MTESLWATLKVECFYRHAFATRAQVYDAVSDWTEDLVQSLPSTFGHRVNQPVVYKLTLNPPTTALKAA